MVSFVFVAAWKNAKMRSQIDWIIRWERIRATRGHLIFGLMYLPATVFLFVWSSGFIFSFFYSSVWPRQVKKDPTVHDESLLSSWDSQLSVISSDVCDLCPNMARKVPLILPDKLVKNKKFLQDGTHVCMYVNMCKDLIGYWRNFIIAA